MTYSREDIIRLAADAGLRDIGSRGLRMEDLEITSLRALDDAKAAIARGTTLAARRKGTPFNFGFILRSRGPGANSNVLCASPLLRRIRQLIYSRPPQRILQRSARHQYNSHRAFPNPSDHSDFLGLFPKFASYFAMYEVFINDIIDTLTGQTSSQKNTQTRMIARVMLTHIMRIDRDFNPSNASACNIVRDFVVRPEYSDLLLRAMQSL